MTDIQRQPMVVIGAGLAGLAASLTLARAGRQVVLLEAADAPGCCCSTTEVSGFTFNNGAVYVAVPSLLRASFQRLGVDFDAEVPLERIGRPHETRLEDGTVVQLSSQDASQVEGPQSNVRTAMLRDGLAALRRQWGPIYHALINEVLPYEPSVLRTVSRLWRYLPRMSCGVGKVIATYFPDPGLQAAVASTLLYTGLAPDRLPATQIIGLLALLEEGFYLPHGGMGAISAALFRQMKQHSIASRFNERVSRIDIVKGAVQGVVLASGERIDTQHVIATCSGFEVARHLLPQEALPRSLAKKIHRAPLSHRAVSIQIGCSGATLPKSFIVNRVPSMDQQQLMHVWQRGAPRWLAYTIPTRVLPHLAPNGKSVIELYAPATGIGSASEWASEMTDLTVRNYLEALSVELPGLCIDTIRVLDPKGFALSRHLYEGALYGLAPGVTPDKFFPHRTALRGLYLAGQTTFPGYGVPSAILSGIQAAEALEQDCR